MMKNENVLALQERVEYLERKCSYLVATLEDHLTAMQIESKSTSLTRVQSQFGASSDLEVVELRAENERLEKKLSFLYNSVSWRITKPIRLFNRDIWKKLFRFVH